MNTVPEVEVAFATSLFINNSDAKHYTTPNPLIWLNIYAHQKIKHISFKRLYSIVEESEKHKWQA